MLRQSTCLVILAVIALAIAKPPPIAGGFDSSFAAGKPAFPWATFAAGKSPYARSLGPSAAPVISTITVPFGPKKTSPFFPKFVDPQAMISKKTDMLTNFFGGIGPVSYPLGGVPYTSADSVPPKPVLYATAEKDASDLQDILGSEKPEKRGIFAPVGPKFGPGAPPLSPFATKFGPAGVPFSPFAPKFGPGAKFPPFGPFAGYGTQFGSANGIDGDDDTTNDFSTSRKKRSVLGLGPETPKGPPPPYPGLGTIPEEPESDTPKEYLPGMFGPFSPISPFAPPAPVIDPSIFISKKTAFLNTLFSNLATSTPLPPGVTPDPLAPKSTIVPADFWLPFNVPTQASVSAVTDVPVPKSTIVPEGFWAPSSIIPGPTEYNDKVGTFLKKLFDSLNLNATSQVTEQAEDVTTRVARSVDDIQTISTAKDAIVDSIIAELGSIKTDILSTLDEAIAAQKAAPAPKKPIKPGKPVSPWAAMFAPPTVDPTAPFRQKISSLSQVFDMLTGLQKNITAAITDAVNSAEVTTVAPVNDFSAFNVTLLDAIKQKLDSLDKPATQPVTYPFWAAYPGSVSPIKRNVDDDDYYFDERDNENRDKRGVKMTMHQGYQSMPPGAIETVSAGGGSTPGHQGGGINLLNSQPFDYQQFANIGKQWAEWGQNLHNNQQDDYNNRNNNHHHHNHH